MASNETNTTISTPDITYAVSWSAVGFLIFVAIIFVISIVLIFYFEKLCCFARHRFLKHLLRRLCRTSKSKSISTIAQSIPIISISELEANNKSSSKIPEYLWIAGQREHISAFQPSMSLDTHDMGTDLPDDDYTTLVPPVKKINSTEKKLPDIPKIIEHAENDSLPKKVKQSNSKLNDRRKTRMTRISRHQASLDSEILAYPHSAPSSPSLLRNPEQKSPNRSILMDQANIDAKSVSSDQGLTLKRALSNGSLTPGTLEVRLKFDAKNSKMWIFVIKGTLDLEQSTLKQTLVQIHLTMLPNKRIRYRTQAKPADNAMFAEEFFCKVSSEPIQTQGIRFRLYTNKRFKREKLVAEATVMFGSVNLDEDMCKIIQLEPVCPSDDSEAGSFHSRKSSNSQSRKDSIIQTGGSSSSTLPEIEIGLAYDKNQAVLLFEIGKGVNFDISSLGRAPDTYAQLTLLNSHGEQIASNKTVTRCNQHHPVFAERYPFNIEENLLSQITFVLTIINKRSAGKENRNIGWISFGHGVSGDTQVAHWDSMMNAQGETITRCHALLES
ncbi:unnamed protein product [Rotaria socialis]|uniref:C2 domain-containing protein n=1 Tax=Rotaria socialis TaxID=392032 RepID=A0A818P1R2_9BILA|nr:unnamed protein product [Rotaria socialis]